MACITISGFPCSGKTKRCSELKEYLEAKLASEDFFFEGGEKHKVQVIVISDDSLGISRSVYDEGRAKTIFHCVNFPREKKNNSIRKTCYFSSDGRAEKPARASLFAAVTRALSPSTILIIDAMNYIKGFRYQIYCAAREAQVRICTVSKSPHPYLG